jgi:DNA-binding NarL/FixJ family response regulator
MELDLKTLNIREGNTLILPSGKKAEDMSLHNKKESFLKAKLTLREKEILKLVVEGYTGQEIAEQLFVGFKTVEYYRINLLLKLDVKNTAALVKKALELGLTD